MSACSSCASPAITSITMTMTAGEVVDFISCRRCEHRSWQAAGQDLPLDRVLTLATRRKAAGRR